MGPYIRIPFSKCVQGGGLNMRAVQSLMSHRVLEGPQRKINKIHINHYGVISSTFIVINNPKLGLFGAP